MLLRVDRTLESSKWWTYRFKTEEEFIKQYGGEWKTKAGWGYEHMDYLLGSVLEYDFPDDLDEIELPIDDETHKLYEIPNNRTVWYIDRDMLTKNNKQIPNYKPKKFSREI